MIAEEKEVEVVEEEDEVVETGLYLEMGGFARSEWEEREISHFVW